MSNPDPPRRPLPAEFERPKLLPYSAAEIEAGRQLYYQLVASFALEDHEPGDFGKIVSLERIRGELTPAQAEEILCRRNPAETRRIEEKIQRLRAAGLSWRDL